MRKVGKKFTQGQRHKVHSAQLWKIIFQKWKWYEWKMPLFGSREVAHTVWAGIAEFCRVLVLSCWPQPQGFWPVKQEDDFCSSYDRRVPTERMNVGEFWAFGYLDPATDLQISTALKSKSKYFELFILFFPKITGLKLTLLSSKWSARYTSKT